jgi:glyoxylase-like metal-dependent hydrolase (beta-lactamase superfamily II)
MYDEMIRSENSDKISLVAFKYGESPLAAQNAFYGNNSDTQIDISWLFFLINYDHHHILVDVGNGNIDAFISYGFSMRNFSSPVSLLKEYGLSPDDITEIFVTHADFDHIGDIALYKNADVYIQENELKNCCNLITQNRKIITFQASIRALKKFQLLCVGGHTEGSSIIVFRHSGMKYVLAGDACYVNASLEQQIPTGRTCNVEQSREFIRQFNSQDFKVYFSHEPSIVPGNGTYKILLP